MFLNLAKTGHSGVSIQKEKHNIVKNVHSNFTQDKQELNYMLV